MKMFGDSYFKLVWLRTFKSTCFNNIFLHNPSQHFTQPWILIKDTMINQKWELIACEFSLRGARGLKIRIMPLVVRWIHVYTFGSSEMTAWLFLSTCMLPLGVECYSMEKVNAPVNVTHIESKKIRDSWILSCLCISAAAKEINRSFTLFARL